MAFDWETWQHARYLQHQAGRRTMWLLDKNMEPVVSLSGFLSGEYSDKCNAPGGFRVELPQDHPAIPTILQFDVRSRPENLQGLLVSSQFVVVETQHYRHTYRVAEIELISEDGVETVAVLGEHIWEHMNHIALWANPGAPLLAQIKYADVQAGDSLRVLKGYLFRNLAREFQPSILRNWNLFSSYAYSEITDWPIMVNPRHRSTTTEWTVLDSRFNLAGEMFEPTLNAAGLQVIVDLWLPGDPQPFPEYTKLVKPTIIIDVVPRAFETASTGTITDVIRGVRTKIANDQVTNAIVLDDMAFDGENPNAWCVWSSDYMHGTRSRLVVKKATDSTVIVGGRSPQIVNSLVAAGSNALWQGIGAAIGVAFPPFAALAAAAGAFIGNIQGSLLKDKLFAWNEFRSTARADAMGPYRYRTMVTPGEAWSLSALQKGFTALQESKGAVSTEFTVGDGQPYVYGRDFVVGDQAAFRSHNLNFGTYVESVTVKVQRGGDDISIGLGDPRNRESPARSLERSVKTISSAIDRVKTVIV